MTAEKTPEAPEYETRVEYEGRIRNEYRRAGLPLVYRQTVGAARIALVEARPDLAEWVERRPDPSERPIHRRRKDREDRILPSKLAHVSGERATRDAARQRSLFSPAMHIAPDGSPQLLLPGFGSLIDLEGPALPLLLYDLGTGGPLERGRGAPLALRLWVESVLSAGPSDDEDHPVAVTVSLNELVDSLYPGTRRPRPNEYRPRLERAIAALDEAWLPWRDPESGKGGKRRIVLVSNLPVDPGDDLTMTVHLPPGSGPGPVVTPRLAQYGLKSAAQYRALINLAYRWFEPGKTRTPVGSGKRLHWVQSVDPRVYPRVADDDDLVAICYPTSARGARRKLVNDSVRTIKALVEAGECRLLDGHILPPEPA